MILINAQLPGGARGSVRIRGSRIVGLNVDADPGDLRIDLHGDRLLPGLINAHDHLQLNSLPPLEPDKVYRHAYQWILDIAARRRSDPWFEASATAARDERLAIGGVKNLLSGVTTVAHHDRPYSFLFDPDYPTGVANQYGWSHSLYIEGEASVRASYRHTPIGWPWIIHAAEGLDGDAREEFERLDRLGCIGPNTLLVHGTALDRGQRKRLDRAAAGLVWCPSSNLRLFGATIDATELIACGRVALGTDSRLSGARDLLAELGIAGTIGDLDDSTLESLVTRQAARLLRLTDRGVLKPGARADILVLPAGARLKSTSRADVRLVLRAGLVRYGDRHYAERMMPPSMWVEVRVDGRGKILERRLAALLSRAAVREPGLELSPLAERAA